VKNIIFFSACFVLSIASRAQTSAGAITFGANMLTSSTNSFDNKAAYEQNLQVRIGFFATNSLAAGLCLETGVNGNQTVPYSFTAFTRWYTGKKTNQTVKFFVEAGIGIANYTGTTTSTEVTQPDNNWMKATGYISPGINVFLGKVAALEFASEYRYIATPNAINRLGVSAGIKFFLSKELFKKAFPNEFVKSH